MSHSSGKENRTHTDRIGEKPQEYTQCQLLRVTSLDTKQIESMIGSRMIQWEKCNEKYGMERFIFTIHRSSYRWEKYGLVDGEKVPYQSLPLQKDGDMDPLVEKGTV